MNTSKRTVEVSARADGQLDEAYLWWAKNRSLEQAERWYREMLSELKRLPEKAESHPLAPEYEEFNFEIRQMLFGLGRHPTHRVLFMIRPNRIEVIAIRHVSQRLLKPDDLVD